jgi:PmbA protein
VHVRRADNRRRRISLAPPVAASHVGRDRNPEREIRVNTVIAPSPMPGTADGDALNFLRDLLERAKAAGADAADVVLAARRSLNVACRLGNRETLERAEMVDLGLRVFVGRRQALVSTSDLSPRSLALLVERAVAMVARVPEDPYCGLADPAAVVDAAVDVDVFAAAEAGVEDLTERALAAETAALAVPGVTNSEGADAAWGTDALAIAATNGLAQEFRRSWRSLAVSVLAGAGTAMERDYEYATAVGAEPLPSAEELGRSAGRRAVARLDPRKVRTAQVPVVFEPRTARSLLGHLATAINGGAIARGTSFLRNKLGQPVFAPGVTVVDDPLRPRGLKSRPFDGEGIPARSLALIEDGTLRFWLTDLASARQLGTETTGRASRSASSLPSPAATNLYLAPGSAAPDALIADIADGLYVTELIGFGVNGVTGDYSRGASGFRIENGALSHPVSEVTVSGNLVEMFRRLIPADDLAFRYGVDSPTVRVDGMTVAGR